ncbi:MAG: ParB N-terminal domain-containing protein [Candidatus Sericytochromatia bacterium]
MLAKKDYGSSIEMQLLKKEKASLESKVFKQQQEREVLKSKIDILEKEKASLSELINQAEKGEVSKISYLDVNLRSNIRDYYEFEEIENLALDILINGQLQPVLITKDNFLISGHRRYYAIKMINENFEAINISNELLSKINKTNFIVTYKIEKLNNDIGDIELQELQYAENNERRNIDNFQLSNLYNSYLEKGFDQKYLVEKYKKTKGNISSIVAIKKIDSFLVRYLKEFQIFAWSKKRFETEKLANFDESKEQFHQNNKGIIGWKPLYTIAKQNSLEEQKRVFLELYGNRLAKEELLSSYFSTVVENKIENTIGVLEIKNSMSKNIRNITNLVDKLKTLKPEQAEILGKNLLEIEKVLSEI